MAPPIRPPMIRRCGPLLIVAALAAGVMLWLFTPVWFRGESFAFRDAAHYYHPLFEWQADEWSQGRIPLWSPYDNCGAPSMANTASSVFYPGKLLFVLPLGFETNYVLYVTTHMALAAAAAFFAARRWAASVPAAGLCALAYAFGGNVLFQYCNVVFLVSAAWLPLGVLAVDRMLVRRSATWAMLLGAVLALMTLGGDPQNAYNLGLCAALYALFLWWRSRKLRRRSSAHAGAVSRSVAVQPLWRRLLVHRFTLLSIAAVSGALLAAVQILPGVECSRLSERAAYARPRSIYEAVEYVHRRGALREGTLAAAGEGLFGQPRPGTHHFFTFNFSVSPWRLPELIWPNLSGTTFPIHRRWSAIIPGGDGLWTPSLYMGLLPVVLGLAACRFRRAPPRVRWLTWVAVLSLLASFGWYGLGWLVHEVLNAVGLGWRNEGLGSPVGGLYWLMVVLLPSYAYFRYPAKLMVFTALALSLLAARGFDRYLGRRTSTVRKTRLPVVLLVLAALSIVLAFAVIACRPWLIDIFTSAPPDAIFGPIDAPGAVDVLMLSLLQTAIVAGAVWAVFQLVRRKPWPGWPYALLALTAIELAVAQGWMITSAPRSVWQQPTAIGETLRRDPAQSAYRIQRMVPYGWFPSPTGRTSSPNRFRQVITWDRGLLMPKYHLRGGHRLVSAPSTIDNHDYRVLLNVAMEPGQGVDNAGKAGQLSPALLRALSTRYLILPATREYPEAKPLEPLQLAAPLPDHVALSRLADPFPRAWIVHDVQLFDSLTTNEPAVVGRRTREALFPTGNLRDLRHSAAVELSPGVQNSPLGGKLRELAGGQGEVAAPSETATCRLVVDEPQRVEIEVELDRPGLLVLNDLYYPGWTCSHGEILRTNRTMRGVLLPAGPHRVIFTYHPLTFYTGAALSLTAWLALLAVVVVCRRSVMDGKRRSGDSS